MIAFSNGPIAVEDWSN